MKYSILGFNQQKVLEITKDVIVEQSNGEYPKTKTLKLDCIDLLILQDVADFMNRRKIIKYTIDDKIYFSIQYSAIIEDLPILGIKKQALSDRLSKLVELEMLEKVVIKNQAGSFVAFRLGEKYESIKYTPSESEIGTSSTLHLQEYSDTFAEVADYTPKYTSTNNSSTNTKEEIKENKKRKKENTEPTDDDHTMFEEFRKKYKGKKRGHDTEFNFFISQNKDWKEILPKLIYAVEKENHLREQAKMARTFFPEPKNMQTYLNGKNKSWELYLDGIEKHNSNEYNPICDGISLMWNDYAKCFITPFDITTITDGYNDDNRPDGAVVMWRGYKYRWNRNNKTWLYD